MQIPLGEAYAVSCQKIGEGIMREAILHATIAEKDAEIAQLKEKLVAAGLIEEATEIVEGAADANHGDRSRHGSNGSVPDPPSEG